MFPPPLAIPPPWAGRLRAAGSFLIGHGGLLVCALFALAGLALAGDYGIGADEGNQRQTAAANLDYILGRADRIESYNYHDRVYGVAFELPLLLAERALGLADYYHIHRLRLTLTHLFFILGGFFCYRLAWRLFDNRLLALLALLFYLLHPRLYAHSFFNSKDLPFASMFAVALYLLERAFRRDTPGAFVLLGVAVGLLTNLRIMGIMLLPAVIAMRGLDLFYAAGGAERKHILRTAGLFGLAAGLTLYALAPYAWTNPLDYLAASLELTVNHQTVWFQLFQGARIPSDQLPPHYTAVWFAITTPPPLLLLGLVGTAAALAGGLARPGAAFRPGRLRFMGLLLAGFLLPPLAAAALGANQYDDWRHFYFIAIPFGLLAAGGLHWLAAALARRRPWRRAAYGLAAAGLGLVALQMTQLHTVQDVYFNFLADRATPEYLRTQYGMDYLRATAKAALTRLAEIHPEETVAVQTPQRHWRILPPALRQRLRPYGGGAPVDYELIHRPEAAQGDWVFNAAYRRRIYNNTVVVLRPLAAARMTPAAVAAWREIYRQATAGEPIIRADYAVYLDGRRLTFVKEDCGPAPPPALFTAKLFPRRPETLPPHWWNPGSYAVFQNTRVQLDGRCLAVLQLPAGVPGDLMLRQDGGAAGWEELYSLAQPGLRELIAGYRQSLSSSPATEFRMSGKGRPEPAAGPAANAFEVFIDRESGRNRLLYAKENCSPAQYAAGVTLHIYPVHLTDLPAERQAAGFENRDFPIAHYGGRPGGDCIAVVPLPDYPIAAIRTGQAGMGEVNLYPPADPGRLRAIHAALADHPPNIRADFDLYLRDNQLIYRRETCNAAATTADFFLHIIPQDLADLPADRQAAGFANLDFAFARYGGVLDGKCLAAVPLPNYPIKFIRTGQFLPGQGDLWAAELTMQP